MLLELRIQNLAVIDELALEFGPGLNVLTGETGAGKSIIVGALGLVLGEKAEPHLVRTGEPYATVEAAFEAALPPETRRVLEEAGIPLAEGEPIIVARRIGATGRSRAHINGRLATNALLKTLGEAWIDLHGQHEHQSLFRTEVHRELLDAYAQVGETVEAIRAAFERIQALRSELRRLQEAQREWRRERERLEHEIAELEEANLQEGEDEALDAERRRLMNAERLVETAEALYRRLYDAPSGSVLDELRRSLAEIGELRGYDDSLKDLETRLETVYYEIEDVAQTIGAYREAIEFHPARLDEVESRLHLIFQLKRKYGPTIADILTSYDEARSRLRSIETGAEAIAETKQRLRAELRSAGMLAFALSDARKEAAERLARRVEQELAALGMEKARFFVSVEPVLSESGLIRRRNRGYNLSATGIDRVAFEIAPNVGEEPRPLNKIASGGELSRVMLALKTTLSSVDPISCLVFDEVDAGIGGQTATIVGHKLRELSHTTQVLCITHLPQIAALADRHYRVEKCVAERGGELRTRTVATRLDRDERIAEIARMLGGETSTSRAHAQELLGFTEMDTTR